MGLSIKNDEVEERVRRLAEMTGKGVTEAIDDAVQRRLSALQSERDKELARLTAALDDLWQKYGPLPPLDHKAIDEEMYDENGLPR